MLPRGAKILRRPTQEEIEANLGLVYNVAEKSKHYCGGLVDFDDLVSWGTDGLIHALSRFDPSRGFRLSPYAMKCIKGFILQGIRATHKEIWKARERGEDVSPYILADESGFRKKLDTEPLQRAEVTWDLKKLLRRKWKLFTPQEKTVLTIFLTEGLTITEVGRKLGISRQGAWNAWRSAIYKLRQTIKKEAA